MTPVHTRFYACKFRSIGLIALLAIQPLACGDDDGPSDQEAALGDAGGRDGGAPADGPIDGGNAGIDGGVGSGADAGPPDITDVLCPEEPCEPACTATSCGAQVCDPGTGTCRGCLQDAECLDAETPYCDIESGDCVASPPPCEDNTLCNGTGWCCDGSCHAGGEGGCCTDDDCPGQSCSLDTHQCVPITCDESAPSDRFYVDSDAADDARGVGSEECPFRSLATALANIPADRPETFTLCTRGTFAGSATGVWPRQVPQNVVLDGRYCEANLDTPTLLQVPAGLSSVYFHGGGPAGMHGYRIVSRGIQINSGISVANTLTGTVTISDVIVNGFHYGILASHAHLTLQDTVEASGNATGLFVLPGATVVIDVTEPSARSEFNGNDTGIRVAGTLDVRGAQYDGGSGAGSELARTVVVKDNAVGLGLMGDSKVTLDHIEVNRNSTGVYISTAPTVRIRNSSIRDNSVGIVVSYSDDGYSGSDASMIDLGTSATIETSPTSSGAGNNYILDNADVGISVGEGVTGIIQARGNVFGTQAAMKDCRAGAGAPALSWSNSDSPTSPVDVTRRAHLNVSRCTFE